MGCPVGKANRNRSKTCFLSYHSKECYYSSEIRHIGREKASILRGKGGFFSYCILISDHEEDQLDIVHSSSLKQKKYRMHPPTVWGVAKTRPGAIGVVVRIMDDAARAGMPGNAKAYLLMKEQKGREAGAFRRSHNS